MAGKLSHVHVIHFEAPATGDLVEDGEVAAKLKPHVQAIREAFPALEGKHRIVRRKAA